MVTSRHVSAQDVPRVDWGALIGRSQELSRLDPSLTLSDAIWRAAVEYENGHPPGSSPSERRLVQVARIHPERLMKPLPAPRPFRFWRDVIVVGFRWYWLTYGAYTLSVPFWSSYASPAVPFVCVAMTAVAWFISAVGFLLRHRDRLSI